MARVLPWRRKCPEQLASVITQALHGEFYVVNENGPTSFVIKSSASSHQKFRVSVGEKQSCSCAASDLCVHIFFVMLKIFRVPRDNPLAWQLSLVPSEVDQILLGRYRPPPEVNTVPPPEPNRVGRRTVTEEDVCAICYDSMNDPRGNTLVFCRFGCGQNFHSKCMGVYASSQKGNALRCPMCRTGWGPWEPNQMDHNGTSCRNCRLGPISGARYKCAFCTTYDLCETCFMDSLVHPQHPFDVAAEPNAPFAPADRSRAQPSVRIQAPSLPPVVLPSHSNVPPHLAALLFRDLTDADYETLQLLDDTVAPPPSRVLTQGMASAIPAMTWTSTGAGMDCMVCLSGMEVGQCVKSLPLCSHAFHGECIDRWLTQHRAVCPVCTCPVEIAEPPTAPPPPPQTLAARKAPPKPSNQRPRGNSNPGVPPQSLLAVGRSVSGNGVPSGRPVGGSSGGQPRRNASSTRRLPVSERPMDVPEFAIQGQAVRVASLLRSGR